MSGREVRGTAFAARPRDAESWVRAAESPPTCAEAKADTFTARLTVDLTPELRGRIKVAAFTRGLTVADMLRALLDEAFPDPSGGRP